MSTVVDKAPEISLNEVVEFLVIATKTDTGYTTNGGQEWPEIPSVVMLGNRTMCRIRQEDKFTLLREPVIHIWYGLI